MGCGEADFFVKSGNVLDLVIILIVGLFGRWFLFWAFIFGLSTQFYFSLSLSLLFFYVLFIYCVFIMKKIVKEKKRKSAEAFLSKMFFYFFLESGSLFDLSVIFIQQFYWFMGHMIGFCHEIVFLKFASVVHFYV